MCFLPICVGSNVTKLCGPIVDISHPPPTHAHIHKYWIRSRFVQFSKDLRIAMIITLDHQTQVNATKNEDYISL